MSSQAHADALEPHVPDGETVVEWFANDERTIAVTDRRVVDMTRTGSENEHQTLVKSTLLGENVVGTEYRRELESKFDVAQIVVGGLLALVGVGAILFALSQGGEDALVFAPVGLVLSAAGAVLLKKAEWTSNGFTSVTVQRHGDLPDKTWRFPVGETAVPQAISEQVAELHGPE